MKISSPSSALSWAALVQALQMRAASLSSLSPRVLITSGCCVSSNTAFFQSILGWKAANQGYPKTSSSSPMWVTRKRISSFLGPTCTCRSTYSLMDPDLLWVPSIFQMYRGFFRGIFPIFILLRSLSLMKLWLLQNRQGLLVQPSYVSSVKLLGYSMTCIYTRIHSLVLRCAPWPLGLHLLKIQLLWERSFSVSPHEIKFLIFWECPSRFEERYQSRRNVFCSGSEFFQKTSFLVFFFGFIDISISHPGFYWFLSSFVLVGAEELNMAFLVAMETFHRLAPIRGFFFCTGCASFSSLFPIIGSGPIGTCVHRVRVWSRHLDSQDPRQ